jgi:hypothetical protein
MTELVRKEDGSLEVVVKVLGQPDQLGRVWNPEAMAKAVEKFNARVKQGRAHGELGQPARYAGQSHEQYKERCQTVEMGNTCCQITDVKMEDNRLLACMKPAGRWKGSLEQLLEDDVPVTLGIRALCDIKADGEVKVKDIVTFDVISPT